MAEGDPYTQPGLLLGAPIGAGALGWTGDIQSLLAFESRDEAMFTGWVEYPPKPPKPRPPAVRPPRREIVVYSGIDIRLVQDPRFPNEGVVIDWRLRRDGTLDDTEALATAIIVALGTDHLADGGEELPDPDSTDRRGWWGDYEAPVIWDGWDIGSKLWLLKREAILGPMAWRGSTTVRIEHYIRQAIQPFIDRRIGSQMSLEVTKNGRDRIDALVRIYRGPTTEIDLRYSVLWTDIERYSQDYGLGGERRGDYW